MRFALTPEQQALVERARAAVARVSDAVVEAIDTQGVIPAAVRQAIAAAVGDPFAGGAVGAAAAIEEVAVVTASVAVAVGLDPGGTSALPAGASPLALPGLRGAEREVALAASATEPGRGRARLAVAAAALGVGRAAIGHALDVMRARQVRPGGDEPTPYWALSDSAAEVDAARLLAFDAAGGLDRGEDESGTRRALALATAAAARAVDAALAVTGPSGWQRGSRLERLSRDARTLSLVLAGRAS